MPGDRVTSEDGREVEFPRTRSGRPPQVVTVKHLTAVAALFATVTGVSVGGAARFVLDARVETLIRQHDKDPDAHALFVRSMERIKQADDVDDAEKARLQNQLDALSRDVRETREAVIRLEAQLRRGAR
jgi:hypothetical protein